MSDVNETICLCSVTSLSTTFATTFYVPPNTIDFSKVFSKFDASNASVYGTVIALIVLYIACLIWARRQDKKDLIRVSKGFHIAYIFNFLQFIGLNLQLYKTIRLITNLKTLYRLSDWSLEFPERYVHSRTNALITVAKRS